MLLIWWGWIKGSYPNLLSLTLTLLKISIYQYFDPKEKGLEEMRGDAVATSSQVRVRSGEDIYILSASHITNIIRSRGAKWGSGNN